MFFANILNPLFVGKGLATGILCVAIMGGVPLDARRQTPTAQPFPEQDPVSFLRLLLSKRFAGDILHSMISQAVNTLDMVVCLPAKHT